MRSSPTITLFSEQPELNQRPYTFLVSILTHLAAITLLFLGIASAPKVKAPVIAEHYAVRHLDLHTLKAQMQRALGRGLSSPRSQFQAHAQTPGESRPAPPPALRLRSQAPLGPQTLVQPDIPKPLTLLQEIPVPTLLIWQGKSIPIKTLVAPLPEMPAVADVKPSTQLPNQEQNLADVAIAASNLAVQAQAVLPSTTSPLVVQGPKPTPPAPITTAEGSAQSTPAAVMSLSDHQMPNGAVTLAPVNETVASNQPGTLAAGQPRNSPPTEQANAAGNAGDKGARQDASDPSGRDGAAQGASAGFGQGYHPSAAHITLPKDGQFGAVVVGSSLEEKYPETAELWSGRLAYTVYLHVGLARSWILQYSLSRAADAAEAGSIAHIEAPWPYNIVRPNIAPGAIDADALMIHGIVTRAGRFQALAVVFPPQFPQAQFVLNSLAQWQFRPATQNGKNIDVEVLLIIPEEPE